MGLHTLLGDTMKATYIFALVLLSQPLCETVHAFGKKVIDPVDVEMKLTKPTGDESPTTGAAMCELLSEKAKALGVTQLVIGFEGLASFDASGTRAAYNYHYKLAHGQTASAPRKGGDGYLLHGLLVPAVTQARGRFEFLVFPHGSIDDGKASVAEGCATAWMREPGRSLVISGHSYGGHAAQDLAANLERAGVPVAAVVTVDPRLRIYAGAFWKTNNVRLWENYYQTNTPFLNGYVVPGADLNVDLSRTGVGHTGMPFRAEVSAALQRALR